MKLVLDINDNRAAFFKELIGSFDFIRVLHEAKDKELEDAVQSLSEAFEDVKRHESGEVKLKSAFDLLK